MNPGSHFRELGGDSLAALRVCRRLAAEKETRGDDGEKSKCGLDEGGQFGELLGVLAPRELLAR